VTESGQAKVLDFGLAKLVHERAAEASASQSPEFTPPSIAKEDSIRDSITKTGVAVGMPAYMSPEQVRREELDTRTDLFSLGATLYEIATGLQPFTGNTPADVQQAITGQTPRAIRSLNPQLPSKLEAIIIKALEKDRALRYQTAADLKADLQRLKRDSESARVVGAGLAPPTRAQQAAPLRRRMAIALASAVIIAAAVLAYWLTHRPTPPAPRLSERRLTANSSENPVSQGVISPDGKYLAYCDPTGMHLKLIQTGETIAIPQPEGLAPDPYNYWWPYSWFPDGTKFIASRAEASGVSTWVVSVMGGPPRKLRDDADGWSASPDGTLIAFGRGSGFLHSREIWLMGAQGEEPRRFVSGSEDDSFWQTAWSPDGQRITYYRFRRAPVKPECAIESRDLKGGQPTVLVSDSRSCDLVGSIWWSPAGRFIYTMLDPLQAMKPLSNTNLWEIRVDTRTGQA
jgi:hypothetical protein